MPIDRRNLGRVTSTLVALLAVGGEAVLSPAVAGDSAAPLLATPHGAAASGSSNSPPVAGQPVTGQPVTGQPVTGHDMSHTPPHWMGQEEIAFLIYPGFTALDMVGPHYMLSSLMGAKVHVVAKTKEPVTSDSGLIFTPTRDFSDCPADLDILCIPGGSAGTLAAIRDEATLNFVKDRGARAKRVTSVCTGSLVLGAAGLLEGYKATSHWIAKPLLAKFGAIPTEGRVVHDRNRITGGGVTAGIDFGLALVAELRDRPYAEAVQLLAEYAPAPPFNAGTPETAPPEAKAIMDAMFVAFLANAEATLRDVRSRNP